MSVEAKITTGARLEAGQLHEGMRQRGCEDMFAVFEVSELSPRVKYTIAENVPEAYARLFAESRTMLTLLQEAVLRGPVGGDEWCARASAVIAKAMKEKEQGK